MNPRRIRMQLLWDAEAAERERQLNQERQERMERRMRYASNPKGSREPIPKGTQFGRLTVISDRCRKAGATRKESGYICRCTCGVEQWIPTNHLNSGLIISCGCFRKGVLRHGQAGTRTHKAWLSMRQRCQLPSQDPNGNYGQRGIKVDPAWESFEQFFADMGSIPSRLHTLERKDVNGDYCKANCIWATRKVQANNTRTNVRLFFRGATRTLSQIVEMTGQSYTMVHQRVRRYGWSIEDAVTKPNRIRNKRRHFMDKVESGKFDKVEEVAE